jgi:ABC-type nitrate/sulfonate/bicarbonate transport system substrate-binding protein
MRATRLMSHRVDRRSLLAQAAALAGIAVIGTGPATAAGLPLTLQIPTRSGASWPLWIALEGGYYAKHGIDAKVVFGVHPAGLAMLISGEAQMTNYGLEQVVAAVARDPSLVLMGSSLNKGSFGLIARPEFTSVAQLKGKRIGVARVGDVPYFYTIDLLNKHGLTAKDVQWVSVPADSAARATVLVGGQVDASLLTPPSYYRLEAMGLKLLDNISNYDDIVISTGYVFKKTWVAANRGMPIKIIMAHAEAIKRFYEDKTFAIAAYRKNDPAAEADVARLYDDYIARNTLDRVPLLSKHAVAAAAERLVADIPALKGKDLGTSVDMSDVRKLIADGFFETLFGPSIKAEQERKLKDAFA